ncbi:MAG: hypothetical protein GY757_18895 [bacterium]|nr:hypothetical protein [bacterium]
MLIVPRKSTCIKDDRCKHFKGVKQPDGTERNEFYYCAAFPDGIPIGILTGEFNHRRKYPGQKNEIVFKEGE